MNISNGLAPDDDENLSINSCANCNRSHRKCDRKLPHCSECTKKHKVCVYETPKRVKRTHNTEKKQRFQPYPPKETKNAKHDDVQSPSGVAFSSLDHILSTLPNHQDDVTKYIPALERYFEQVYLNSPMVNRTTMDRIITIRQRIMKNENITLTLADKEEIACVFAMQAFFYYRIEVPEMSKRSLEICLNLIGNVFDRVMTSYSLAAAFVYLSFIFLDLGEVDRASFYMHCVRGYVKKCEAMPQPEKENFYDRNMRIIRERFLRLMSILGIQTMSNQTDMIRLFKIYLSSHLQFKQYKKLLETFQQKQTAPSLIGFVNDEGIDKFLPLADMIRHDLDNNRNSFDLTADMIDLIVASIKGVVNEPFNTRGEADLYSKRVGFYTIALGAKIQCLQRAGLELGTEVRRVAEQIADVSSSPNFHFCHHGASGSVALALNILMKFLERSTEPNDQNILMDKMKQCINTLKIIASKYRIVTLKYGVIIANAENIIKAHKDHMQLMELYSTLGSNPQSVGGPISTVNTTDLRPLDLPPSTSEATLLETQDLESLLSEFFTEDDFKKPEGLSDAPETPFSVATSTEDMLFL